ncbi:lysozyme inhibitor LprI family protein [Burkholderia sp. MR1-5-21]
MNVCAWRDRIVAERELQQAVDRQASEHPARKAALEAKMTKWKKARGAPCEKAARNDWGDGSMRPAALAIFQTESTKKMTKKLSAASSRQTYTDDAAVPAPYLTKVGAQSYAKTYACVFWEPAVTDPERLFGERMYHP